MTMKEPTIDPTIESLSKKGIINVLIINGHTIDSLHHMDKEALKLLSQKLMDNDSIDEIDFILELSSE